MKKVLILEDEENIRSFVVINLRRAGYQAIEAATGMEALEKLNRYPDIGVAILDIMLPDTDGFEVCRRIRATNKQIGIIMLTARTQEMDKVTGLMTGAFAVYFGGIISRTTPKQTVSFIWSRRTIMLSLLQWGLSQTK